MQGATLELEVRGGPGHVQLESDQVTVTPLQFGADPTRLQVAVRPLTSGVLWTTLTLVTASETRELPLTAQWQDGTTLPAQLLLGTPLSPSARTPLRPRMARASPARSCRPRSTRTSHRCQRRPCRPPVLILMGSASSDANAQRNEQPQHTLDLPRYWIGKTAVTNAQFRPFVAGDGYTNRAYWTEAGWTWRTAQSRSQPDSWNDVEWNGDAQPIVGVSWYEAWAYTRWLSAQTEQDFRLPTEAAWEKAARGSDGRIYPWGDSWDAQRANSRESGFGQTTPVGSYPSGASPVGALDMAGNVWEWMASLSMPYPYNPSDGREEVANPTDKLFTLRGGSWYEDPIDLRAPGRFNSHPSFAYRDIGLRLARHPYVSSVLCPDDLCPEVGREESQPTTAAAASAAWGQGDASSHMVTMRFNAHQRPALSC